MFSSWKDNINTARAVTTWLMVLTINIRLPSYKALPYLSQREFYIWAAKSVSNKRKVEAVSIDCFGSFEIFSANISLYHQDLITAQHRLDIAIVLKIFKCKVQRVS